MTTTRSLPYLLTLLLTVAPVNALTQSTGEIRYQSNVLEFWNGSAWVSMDASDSSVDCTSNSPGEIRFNSSRLEFCNGTTWRQMDGTVTADTCSTTGEMEWDSTNSVIRFCNGTNWVETAASSGSGISCPTGYIPVPADGVYTTQDFCVMKYEAKDDGSGNAVSQAAGSPWSNTSRTTAIAECQALGAGYDLVSNSQWQTIARNITDVDWNWSSGTAYNGQLNNGHSDNSPASLLAADADDNNACSGTGQTCDGSTWHAQRRTFMLSNSEVLWDVAGNASEWVSSNPYGPYVNDEVSLFNSGDRQTYYGNDQFCGSPGSSPYCGFGMGYVSAAVSLLRGGARDWAGDSGIFTVVDWLSPSVNEPNAGFRCVYNAAPPSGSYDPAFSNVVLLVQPGTSDTNATDLSPSAHTITENNGATLSTAIADPWGGSQKIITMNGGNSYLSIPDSNDWYYGDNDFTVEFWAYFNSLSAGTSYSVMKQIGGGNTIFWYIDNGADGGMAFAAPGNFFSEGVDRTSPTGQWTHVALVKSGESFNIYIDGVSVVNASAFTIPDLSANLEIGYNSDWAMSALDGYMTGIRITKGMARYTGNFIPPTEPFPITAPPDNTPDTFDFPDVYGAATSTSYNVAATVSGFNIDPLTASVSGGDAQVRKNGTGTWGSSVDVSPGDVLNLRMTSSASADTPITATVTVGTLSVDWVVSTEASSCSDPTTGMTADATFPAGTIAGGGFDPNTSPATWHFNADFPASPSGALVEMGGGTRGMGVWTDGTNIYVAAGNGASTSTDGDTVVLSYPLTDIKNTTADIVFAIDPTTGEAGLYVNNCPVASGQTTDASGLTSNSYTGTNGGGFGQTNGSQRGGMSSTAFNGTVNGNLTFYSGELPADFPASGGGGSGIDDTPDAFYFLDVTDADLSTLYEESTVVMGFVGPLTASVSGSGAEIRANHTGSWVTSGLALNPGDTLNIRMTSSASAGTPVVATVSLGTANVDWSVTTASSAPSFVRSNSNDSANVSSVSSTIDITGTGVGNRILIVDALCGDDLQLSISSVVFDPGGGNEVNNPTELFTRSVVGNSDNGRYYILDANLPASGTYTVTVTYSGSCNEIAVGALLYEGVNQTTPWGAPITDTDTAAPYTSPSVSGADGDIVLDFYWTFKPTATVDPGQTIRASAENAGGFDAYYATEKTLSGTSTTFSYNNQSSGWSNELAWGAAVLKASVLSRTDVGNYQSSISYGSGSYVTGSFTPPANSLLVAVVSAMHDGDTDGWGDDIEASMTISNSGGLTATKRIALPIVGCTGCASGDDVWDEGIQVWTAPVGSSPSSMTLTFDAGSFNIYSWDVKVYAYTGYDTASPIGATATGSNFTTLASITLGASPASDSVLLSGLYLGGADVTINPGSGWAELHETYADYQNDAVQERTGTTSPTVSWGTTTNANGGYGIGGWAMEIKVAP